MHSFQSVTTILTFCLPHHNLLCCSTNLTQPHHSYILVFWMSRLPRLRPHHHNPPLPPALLCHHRPTHLLLSVLHHLHRSGIRSWRLMAGVSSASHTMRPYECWSLHTTWWWRWRMSGDCRMPAQLWARQSGSQVRRLQTARPAAVSQGEWEGVMVM